MADAGHHEQPQPAPRPQPQENQQRAVAAAAAEAQRNANPAVGIRVEDPKTHFYRRQENILPAEAPGSLSYPLDLTMNQLNRVLLDQGEVRRMSAGRAALAPIIGALGTVAGVGELGLKALSGVPIAGVVAAGLSGVFSLARRATGENAFSMAARFMNRREDRQGITGLLSRIIHGGESRAVKWAFFHEDKDAQQLLRMYDQMTQRREDGTIRMSRPEQDAWLDSMAVGSRDRINDMIAAGVMEELKAKLIREHNMQISEKEAVKINRMHDAYDMAKRLFERKVPTLGQRQILAQQVIPDRVRTRERSLWMQQAGLVAGVEAAKSATFVLGGAVAVPAIIEGLGALAPAGSKVALDMGGILNTTGANIGKATADVGGGLGGFLNSVVDGIKNFKLPSLPNLGAAAPGAAPVSDWVQKGLSNAPKSAY